ncbi:MAG TPA: DUF5686 and carboxypeptidase regulatory-like domain-containing protein [Chitinophagaceae bacterium]
MRRQPYSVLLILLPLLLLGGLVHAQVHTVKGKVINTQAEPVPYATILVKGHDAGTTAKGDGTFELQLTTGDYQVLVSIVGYKRGEATLTVPDSTEKVIVLTEEAQNLSEVVVRARTRDRADEIMEKLVRKKDSIQGASGAYSYQVYTRAVLQDSGSKAPRKRALNRNKEDHSPGMAMAEVLSRVDVDGRNRVKEERLAVRGNPSAKGMFYPSPTEERFNLYDNLISVPALSPTPFLSPVSKAGLTAYKFKTVKVQRSKTHRIYTISVKPLQVTNATVDGELTISDSAWSILHARFRLPAYHLQEFDYFEVEQDFGFIDNQAWMLTRQQFTYYTKGGKQVYSGQTVASYTGYQFNKQFDRRHFGFEVSVTAQQAYEKDSAYWQAVRSTPLSEREALHVRYTDSMAYVSKTDAYLDSLDRVVSKVTWLKLGLFGQSLHDHKKERTWHFSPLASLYQPFAFGGGRIAGYAYFDKTFPSRRQVKINTELSYGLRNNDINGNVELYNRYDPFHSGYYSLSAGRDFAFIYEGDAWINMVKRNNIYLNNYVGAGTGREIVNGLVLSAEAQLALRRSVADYHTGRLVDSLFGDKLENNQAIAFDPYNALYGKLRLQYTPFQRYRREPGEKINLGSKWPTLYLQWEKGIAGPLQSKVDFDYLEAGLMQNINLGLAGVSRYTVKTGDYLNRKDLRFIDHKFQRRGDPVLYMDPHKSFQALDSSFALLNRFYEGHLLHEFNGLFLNKIPLFKKLQLREVAGAGFLLAPERDLRYAELFAGVERAFTSPFNPLDRFKLGVYVISSASNQFKNPVQFKVGFTTWDKRRNRWR